MSRYDILLPQTPTPADSHGYGTVASVSPLTVLLDGDSTPVYCTSVASVGAGDRVLVLTKRLQRIVLGRVGGPLDTGWTNVTPDPGFTASSLQYRRVGGQVYVRALGLVRTNGWSIGAHVVATIPVPPTGLGAILPAWGADAFRAQVSTLGQLSIYAPAASSNAVALGGSYLID